MAHAMLDGKLVDSAELDPAKHTYIGFFRPVFRPVTQAAHAIVCGVCSTRFYTNEGMREHYNGGCFDIPQYRSIEP